jgi:hypothetical protein
LIEQSFDEAGIKGGFLLRRCADEIWVSFAPREASPALSVDTDPAFAVNAAA